MAEKRKKRKKGNQGNKTSAIQEEMVVQGYAICGNKSEVARQVGLSLPTVSKILAKVDTDQRLQRVRARTLEEIRGKIHGKTVEILDNITPEDIESGLIKKYDKNGELSSVKSYGPSLMQKVTSAAILTDKLKVVEETRKTMAQETPEDPLKMPLPGDVESALQVIGDKVKRLRILDVQFQDKNPDIVDRVQEVAHKASLNDDIEEASYEELDFDGPA